MVCSSDSTSNLERRKTAMKQAKESRRRFLKNVAGLSAAAITSPIAAATAMANPQQPAPQEKPPTPTPAQLLGEIVRQRYGQYLTPDQLSEVVRSLDSRLQTSKRLREFKLKNSDEPDSIFRVLETRSKSIATPATIISSNERDVPLSQDSAQWRDSESGTVKRHKTRRHKVSQRV